MTEFAMIAGLQQRIALYEDMKAYRTLYDHLYEPLLRFSFSFVKSKEAAEEIVSDVFIKLWQMRNDLTEINNLKVYLYTVAKNFSLNYITKYYKSPLVNIDEIEVETFTAMRTPEDLCISSDIHSKIKGAINALPPQCRLVFQLVKEDGLKYKEVATVLNISVLTVRNQVAIAVKKMAEALPAQIEMKQLQTRFSAS